MTKKKWNYYKKLKKLRDKIEIQIERLREKTEEINTKLFKIIVK